MKGCFVHVVLAITLLLGGVTLAAGQDGSPGVRYAAAEIWLDTHDQPLAAYQINFKPAAGGVKIVGIEGASHEQFRDPPYYDPAAMMSERVIIADFSTAPANALPHGKFRIATIHVQITGDAEPEYDAKLDVAATTDGKSIPAQLTLSSGSQS